MDPNVVMLLSNDIIKLVFHEVLSRRRIQFKDLRDSLTRAAEQPSASEPGASSGFFFNFGLPTIKRPLTEKPIAGPAAQEQIEDAVRKLKSANLIEERPAPIKDFSTYYVTANGLNAERELRLATAL
jgi:hypothetical protein